MTAKTIVKNLLLVFVLISVGFALGKEFALRSKPSVSAAALAGDGDRTIVYYVHGSIRCATCNKIEKLARETVQRDFAADLQSGKVQWRTANFQEDEDLAKRYSIASSGVVVVRLKDGREADFKKLDEAWTLVNDSAAFSAYISGEVGVYVNGDRGAPQWP